MTNNICVFVYGTLKKDGYNHYLLGDYDFLGEATTTELFTMVKLGTFPALLPYGSTPIIGECYHVNELVSEQLDMLELPYGYERKAVWVKVHKTGSLLKARCYVAGDFLIPKIQSGIEEKHLEVIDSGYWEIETKEESRSAQFRR